MKKIKTLLLVLAVICTTITAMRLFAKSSGAENHITIRNTPEQVVFYTIHRGSYDKIGQTIGRLFALAGQLDVPADGIPRASITFNTPAGVAGDKITWSAATVQYSLGGADGDQVQRTSGTATRIIANDIATMEFTRFSADPDMLQVDLTTENADLKGDRILSLALNFQIQLRN